MNPVKSASSPITYFVSNTGQAEWLLFIHWIYTIKTDG